MFEKDKEIMPDCFQCNQSFPDNDKLAKHIMASKKTHKRGRKWAAKFLMINKLSPKNRREQRERQSLSEQDRMNKQDSVRELSDDTEQVLTVCPKCKQGQRLMLPVEYTQSPVAWRNDKGLLYITCNRCQSVRYRNGQRQEAY